MRSDRGFEPFSGNPGAVWFRVAVVVSLAGVSLAALVSGASARPTGVPTLYAYAAGRASSPTGCPETSATSKRCSLAEALSEAVAGATVALATPGSRGHYVGNWAVNTPATTASAPLTIEPAPGVDDATLDGNHGELAGCQTSTCGGPVITVDPGVHLELGGVSIENARDSGVASNGDGGAIYNGGGTLSVSGSTFSSDSAEADGGAIDNADRGRGGTLSVSGSTFSGNSAGGEGGAIDNADNDGKGTLTVSASTFSANSAASEGGAIDNADNGGSGALTVSDSTFSGNHAKSLAGGVTGASADDGAIAGSGPISVSDSTFSGNTTGEGGTP